MDSWLSSQTSCTRQAVLSVTGNIGQTPAISYIVGLLPSHCVTMRMLGVPYKPLSNYPNHITELTECAITDMYTGKIESCRE